MSLLKGFLVQCDVIKALVLREARTRFGNNCLGFLWAFIEPIICIITFYGVFYFLNRSTFYGSNIISFITTGLIPFMLFRQITIAAMNAIDANKALLFYPQVKLLDLIIARSLLEIGTIVSVFIVIMFLNCIYINNFQIDNPLNVLMALFTTGFFAMSCGLIFSGLSIYSDTVKRVVPPAIRVLFYISGIFFSISSLSNNLKSILLINPILHLVEMLRSGWFITYESNEYSCRYVLYISIYLTFIGLALLNFSKNKLELT